MKHFALTAVLALLMLSGNAATMLAGSKQDMRYEYTMRHLRLDKATAAKFGPVLRQYIEERNAADDKYEALKDKHKAAIKAGTITDAQGIALMEAKLEAETAELAAKKKYYPEFKKVLKGSKIFRAFDLANDKMSKIEEEMGVVKQK